MEIINSRERKHNNKNIEIHGNFFKYAYSAGYKCWLFPHPMSIARFTMSRVDSMETFLQPCKLLVFRMKNQNQKSNIISTQYLKRIHSRSKLHVVSETSLSFRKEGRIFLWRYYLIHVVRISTKMSRFNCETPPSQVSSEHSELTLRARASEVYLSTLRQLVDTKTFCIQQFVFSRFVK